MKRWAYVTVALYAVTLLLLAAPVLIIALGDWWGHGQNGFRPLEFIRLFESWGFWVWLAVLVAGQFLLLLVPVDISERKLVPRRKLLVPIITSAFFIRQRGLRWNFFGGVRHLWRRRV